LITFFYVVAERLDFKLIKKPEVDYSVHIDIEIKINGK